MVLLLDRIKTLSAKSRAELKARTVLKDVNIRDLLESEYDTDAHFLCYSPTGDIPKVRISKTAKLSASLTSNLLVFDYDNPEHLAWNNKEEAEEKAWEILEILDPSKVYAIYSTRHGLRIILHLPKAYPVERIELLHKQIVIETGVFDEACSDWTRAFRLPFVTRDGIKTSSEEYSFLHILGNFWQLDSVPSTMSVEIPVEKCEVDPGTSSKELIWEGGTKGSRLTAYGKEAKQRLRATEVFPYIFRDHVGIADKGRRDTTIFKFVSIVCEAVAEIDETTEEHILGLLYDSVAELGYNEEGTLWTSILWNKIGRILPPIKATELSRSRKIISVQDRIINGFQDWHSIPEEEDCVEYISKRAIVNIGKGLFILNNDGWFSNKLLTKEQLVSEIRNNALGSIISTSVLKADGTGYRDTSAQELLNKHSMNFSEMKAVVGKPGSYFKDDIFYQNLFTRRTDIEPRYDRDVDDWLQALCNTKQEYDKLCNWIGNALAFDEGPICALSVCGPPGIGKKLLSRGLAECLKSEELASERDLKTFTYGLQKSPFLVLNEGFPEIIGGMHPSESFRSMTAGDTIKMERKFGDQYTGYIPIRFLFLANNLEMIESLAAGKILKPADKEAIAIRLFHINVPDTASTFMLSRGGLSFTSSAGRRWIRSDDGAGSDYIVARHFLWLYERRNSVHTNTGRLLVEGTMDPHVLRSLTNYSGVFPDVVETILGMIDSESKRGLVITEDNNIYVTLAGVQSYHRSTIAPTAGGRLPRKSVDEALQGLIDPTLDSKEPRVLPLRGGGNSLRARWYGLDLEVLHRESLGSGYATAKLEEMYIYHQDIPDALPENIHEE